MSTKTKQCCATCEFNFGDICAGYGKRIDNGDDTYSSSIDEMIKMFPDGCAGWGISLDAYTIEEEAKGHNRKLN